MLATYAMQNALYFSTGSCKEIEFYHYGNMPSITMVTVADPVLHPICYCTHVFDTCTHVCPTSLRGLCRMFVLCVLVGVTEHLLTAVPSPASAGLALNYYTHFTSPIRRYADLVVRTLDYTSQTCTVHACTLTLTHTHDPTPL